MSIPPVSGPFSVPPNPSDSLGLALENEIQRYRQALRTWDDSPTPKNLQKLEKELLHLKQFLDTNKDEIFATAAGQGWSLNGPAGSNYENFFNHTITSIDNFLSRPVGGIADQGLSDLAQLHWLLVNVPNS